MRFKKRALKKKECAVHWRVWTSKEWGDAQNGSGMKWEMKCHCCMQVLKKAVVFREDGMWLCESCLRDIYEEVLKKGS